MQKPSKKKIIFITCLVVIFAVIGMDIYQESSMDAYDQSNTPEQQTSVKTEEEIRHEYYNSYFTSELEHIEYIVESEIVAHTDASEAAQQSAKDVLNAEVPYYQDLKQFCVESKQYMESQYGGKEYNEMYEYLYDAVGYIELAIDDYENCINMINASGGYMSVESNAQEYLELARDNYETYLQLTGNKGYGMINN